MRIHFVGIDGVSMRQLAVLLEEKGYTVSGSDIQTTGHKAENVDGADVVVYTAAIKPDNVELIRARQLNLPLVSRAELLGKIAAMYKNSIAVAGTHGKTTVTGMLAAIFSSQNPTVHMGGCLQTNASNNLPNNIRNNTCTKINNDQNSLGNKKIHNNDDFFITEACEYQRSFLELVPTLAVVLNIDLDHTDCYSSLSDITDSFEKFSRSAIDAVIINGDDKNTASLTARQKITFGLDSGCNYSARSISADNNGCFSFAAYKNGSPFCNFRLSVPGIHNVKNALAAIAVADYYNTNLPQIQTGLFSFGGIARRFEFVGYLNTETTNPLVSKGQRSPAPQIRNSDSPDFLTSNNTVRSDNALASNNTPATQDFQKKSQEKIRVFSDYAHHPKEIECSILTARAANAGNLIAVFEPHTYTRTQSFLDGFAESLSLADKVILLPVYAARESNDYAVNSLDLWLKIKNSRRPAIYFDTYSALINYLKSTCTDDDTILLMGAGDIDKAAKLLVNKSNYNQ